VSADEVAAAVDGGTEQSDIVDSIEQSFSRLFVLVKGNLRDAAASLGPDLQPAAWGVLRHVMRNAPTQAGAIATATGMDKSAVSRQLKELRERGLVTMVQGADDARAVLVSPSDEGLRRVGEVVAGWNAQLRESFEGWSEEELATFERLLARFTAADPWRPRATGHRSG
jgi:DNA-binding MarR family transcriptional regulator